MKDNNIANVNKIGRVGHVIALIMKIVMGIGIAGVVAGLIITLFLPKDLVTGNIVGDAKFVVNLPEGVAENVVIDDMNYSNGNGHAEIDLGNGKIDLTDYSIEGNTITLTGTGEVWNLSIENLSAGLFVVLLVMITTFIFMFFISNLCKEFEFCENPFQESVITALNKFEIMLIVWAAVSMIGNSIANSLFAGFGNADFTVNLSSIFIIVIVYGLISVFKYGAKLQTESDETL